MMVNFWFKRLDLENSLKLIDLLGTNHGNGLKIMRSSEGKSHILILKHDLGPNATAYYAEQLKALFRHLDHKVEAMETESQVVLRVYG